VGKPRKQRTENKKQQPRRKRKKEFKKDQKMEFPEYKEVKVSVANHVATITLFRPHRGNSITPSMGKEVLDALTRIEESREIHVLILTGSGSVFCTGMDLSGARDNSDFDASAFFERLKSFPKPIVCQVNGPAMGGGMGLVFVTDIRISLKKAHFSFPEVKRGVIPALISSYIVPQLGPYLSTQYMLTGRFLLEFLSAFIIFFFSSFFFFSVSIFLSFFFFFFSNPFHFVE
jgi:1,4-dihydroxy-2-naphthoyl-CoA synthase